MIEFFYYILMPVISLTISLFGTSKILNIDIRNVLNDYKALICTAAGGLIIKELIWFFVPGIKYGFFIFLPEPLLLVFFFVLTILFLSVCLFFWKGNTIAKYFIFIAGIITSIVMVIKFGCYIEAMQQGNVSLMNGFLLISLELLFILILLKGLFLMYKSKPKEYIKYQPLNEISQKDFLPVFLLCFFFGGIGAHRLFVGKIGTGILMILTIGGLGVWVIIDLIMLLVGSFRDIDGRIIRYNSGGNISASSLSVSEEIKQFSELKNQGILTEEEFNKKKEDLLNK